MSGFLGPRSWHGYALELLVVFAGVWLSLLAENWRENRSLREAERVSLIRLARDMEVDITDMKGNQARAATGLEAGAWIKARSRPPYPPADSLGMKLSEYFTCSMLSVNTSEYTALRSSGLLNNLRDDDFRQKLVAHYESYEFLGGLHAQDCDLMFGATEAIQAEVDLTGNVEKLRIDAVVTGTPAAILMNPAFRRSIGIGQLDRSFLVVLIDRRIKRLEELRARALELAGVPPAP